MFCWVWFAIGLFGVFVLVRKREFAFGVLEYEKFIDCGGIRLWNVRIPPV